jgi:hypothetical protein
MKLADIAVGNASEMIWPSADKLIPHAASGSSFVGKLLAGSAFGATPGSMKLDTAGAHLSMAAADLMDAARALAASASGGGGGAVRFGGGLFTPAPWASGGDVNAGPDQFTSDELAAAFGETGPNGGGMGGFSTRGYDASSASSASSGTSAWTKDLGAGAALAAGGFGIYNGVRSGGARGDLSATGSGLAMLGALLPKISQSLAIAGPIGMVAGMGLGMITAMLGDPKQERAQGETNTLNAARYTPPTSTTYAVNRYGQSSDVDLAGNARLIVNMNVQTLDAQSFQDNATKISDAVSTVLEGSLSTRLATNIRAVATPQR